MSPLPTPVKSVLKHNRDAQIICVALLFCLASCLGYFLTFDQKLPLPAWPPSGVAFAFILLMGRQVWPGVTIGSLLSGLILIGSGFSISVQSIIIFSCFTALSHTLEALVGSWLLKFWVRDSYPFTSSKNTFRFLFIAVLMCLGGAVVATLGLYLSGATLSSDILKTCVTWLVGNVVGVLLFAPFILAISRAKSFRFSTEKAIEVSLFLMGAVAIVFLLQVEYFSAAMQRAMPFLILPFFLWLAFRFPLTVAVGGVLIVSLLSMFFTVRGQGPFVLDDTYSSTLLLQIFIAVLSISSLVLSSTVTERGVAQNKLLEFNENLEAKVSERTKELQREIATRKEAEAKLQKTNDELSKRNTELDNFVYSVSHDLRAPIASVLGLINLAKKDKDAVMKDTYLDMMNASARQQDYFISEILDQSRNARVDVKREEIMFEPIIDETFSQLVSITPTGKAVERVISIRQSRPFYCDRWRLKVILNNVISNAIRYRNGRDPVIKISVEVTDVGARLQIEDNGKGIASEHLKHVFRMFYRATDDGAGSGLGLYIVKEAVDKLNGSIAIDSEEGKGTTVQLTIPEIAA